MTSEPILAIGSIALDYLELPSGQKGETLGGSLTYFTLAAGSLAPVHPVGIVGSDFPEEGMKLFAKYSINHDGIQVAEGKTFKWGGKYQSDWNTRETLYTELGVFENFNPELSKINKTCSYVYLGNIQPSLQTRILQQIISPKLVVCDTMNLWIDNFKDDLMKVLSEIDILLINDSEVSLLMGVSDPFKAGRKILEIGPAAVVVKMGSHGSALIDKGNLVNVGVYPVKKVIDPTGAGDSFAGGFMGALSMGLSMVESMLWGTATASFCIEGFGTEAMRELTLTDIKERKDTVRAQHPAGNLSNLP